ncbi:FapA family protein [Alkalihalobacillus deserti]|uniref:FapA family protein n=1 Tax=Alkalihalobacillus deserti TaxID=2879466 RepID=UPI001D133BB2|nr:FapA family protein [Alkalihalobacillus deserti]
MQSIVSKGKNINEAIKLGLSLLDTTIKEVNIEILQHDTKGFLRIGSKEAIVKLVKLESESIQPIKEPTLSEQFDLLEDVISSIPDEKIDLINLNLDEPIVKEFNVTSESQAGKAWVEDGKIYCQSSPKHFPMVTVPADIKLFKNNQLVKERTAIVTESETFELKVENEEVETKWKVTIDQQKLKVVLHVEPGFIIKRSIPNIEADYHIHLYVEEIKEVHNHVNYEAIISKLESLKVKQGFNQNEIVMAMETDVPGTFEIATGIEAKEGKDGWVEVKVDLETQVGPRESEDGSVDYREIKSIPTVSSGEVVAIVHEPIPGQSGTTVTNEPLLAKQTLPVSLKLGKGLSIVDDKIVSIESGRPQIEKRGRIVKISIMQKLTHLGDVDIASGNIHFMGDVEVIGHINEGMLVEAEGDIIVRKEVNRATLTASGAIISYGNMVGSEISAGKNNMLIAELGHILGTLHHHTERMIVVINQLIQSPAFKNGDFTRAGLQPLFRILLEKKFKTFPPLAKRYVDVVKQADIYLDDNEWKEVSVKLTQLFLSLSNEQISLEKIIKLSRKMKELYELSLTPVEPDSYIVIANASNSQLYCSGDIRITGKGCVNTKIHAGGKVEISGIIRGGEVYGKLGAVINEAGAEIGTSTVIAVPYDQKVIIHKAMEGTTIKIGNVKHIFKETRHHVVAYLDKNERITFG